MVRRGICSDDGHARMVVGSYKLSICTDARRGAFVHGFGSGPPVKTLKEFLADRAEVERGRADEKNAVQTEWIWAVRRLVEQVREWLSDADQEKLLTLKEDYQEIRELDLGVYSVPRLTFSSRRRKFCWCRFREWWSGRDLSNGLIRVRRAFGRVDLEERRSQIPAISVSERSLRLLGDRRRRRIYCQTVRSDRSKKRCRACFNEDAGRRLAVVPASEVSSSTGTSPCFDLLE